MSVCLTLLVLIVGQARGVEAEAIRFTDETAFLAALSDPLTIDLPRFVGDPGLEATARFTHPVARIFTVDELVRFEYDWTGLPHAGMLGGVTLYEASFTVPVVAVGTWFVPRVPGTAFAFFGEPVTLTAPLFLGILFDAPTFGEDWLGLIHGSQPQGEIARVTMQTTAVPESSTWGLLLLGVVAIRFAAARGVKP